MNSASSNSSDESSSLMYDLTINKVIGTSAKSSNQFIAQDNIIAYVASGGVVVNILDPTDSTKTTRQRFFCANSKQHNLPPSIYDSTEIVERDSYGFPINSPSIITTSSNNSPGADPNIPDQDLSSTSPSKLKQKLRTISSLAISPNSRLLAIGESGYLPRILLFSLAPNSSHSPIMIIYEHSFGINSLAFSPDSKYLCSLGVVNDGYINIWKLGQSGAGLIGSNRCTSVINRMIWHEKAGIITLGLRIIKIWKFEHDNKIDNGSGSGRNRVEVLKGKNCILGQLMNSNFIDGAILNDDEVLVITSSNSLLVLKLQNNFDIGAKLVSLQKPGFDFGSVVVDYEREKVWFGTGDYSVMSMNISELVQTGDVEARCPSPKKEQYSSKSIIKVCNISDEYITYLTDTETIKLHHKETNSASPLTQSLAQNLGGIKQVSTGHSYIFSKQGHIKRLNQDLSPVDIVDFKLPNHDILVNNLTSIEAYNDNNMLVLGDKYGALYIIQLLETGYKHIYTTKAHSSSINEIIYFQFHKWGIIATISRDRMLQFFYKQSKDGEWDILQTVPLHNGNLIRLIQNQDRIFVCSTDRTISVHRLMEENQEVKVYQEKIITLKSSPVAMEIMDEELVVSTIDKSLQIYDITSINYELKRSIKLRDENGTETVLVERMHKHKNLLIAWCADRSLRLFNYLSGNHVSVVWAHSDPLIGMFIHNESELVTIGMDGVLFIWDILKSSTSLPAAPPPPSSSTVVGSSSESESSEDGLVMPMYSKVTRKILPTTSLSKPVSPERKSIRSGASSPLGRSPPKISSQNGGSASYSPPPKLKSPFVKQSSPTPVIPKLQSPLRSSSPVRLSSPVSSQTMRSVRSSIGNGGSTGVKPYVNLGSPTPSRTSSTRVIPGKSLTEITMGKLDEVGRNVALLTAEEKLLLGEKLRETLVLLEDKPNSTHMMLEKYSDKLLELFEEKLNLTSETRSSKGSLSDDYLGVD
ncbi:uncharacterized protein J8A68_000678 [[Candida] subhashii]|uniref:Uncharacterized protein n=1 Tax=[Candida] subhashii TaxID=561895 RepID=A0A8J5UUF4_9ASCO|nr:uncharacterized protein J8A68_000678 [[Candida] subhashii]KAG7665852.1 hypothetical protein J8A68_000678 [[Candida] subhashii]